LNCAFQNFSRCGAKIVEGMAVMRLLLDSVPKMREIWQFSAVAAQGRDSILNRTLMLGVDMVKKVEKGDLEMDDIMKPM
jgi:hypothetical protein